MTTTANLLSDVLKQIVDEYGNGESLVLPAVAPDPDTESKVIITGSAASGYTLTMISLYTDGDNAPWG